MHSACWAASPCLRAGQVKESKRKVASGGQVHTEVLGKESVPAASARRPPRPLLTAAALAAPRGAPLCPPAGQGAAAADNCTVDGRVLGEVRGEPRQLAELSGAGVPGQLRAAVPGDYTVCRQVSRAPQSVFGRSSLFGRWSSWVPSCACAGQQR